MVNIKVIPEGRAGDAQKQNMRHALAVIANNELFMFNVGEITVDDLRVSK